MRTTRVGQQKDHQFGCRIRFVCPCYGLFHAWSRSCSLCKTITWAVQVIQDRLGALQFFLRLIQPALAMFRRRANGTNERRDQRELSMQRNPQNISSKSGWLLLTHGELVGWGSPASLCTSDVDEGDVGWGAERCWQDPFPIPLIPSLLFISRLPVLLCLSLSPRPARLSISSIHLSHSFVISPSSISHPLAHPSSPPTPLSSSLVRTPRRRPTPLPATLVCGLVTTRSPFWSFVLAATTAHDAWITPIRSFTFHASSHFLSPLHSRCPFSL